jgi:diguanylate cyclase (GGDEF)-like protein
MEVTESSQSASPLTYTRRLVGNSRTSSRHRVLAVLHDEQTAPLFARLVGASFDLEHCRPEEAIEAARSGEPVAAILCECDLGCTAGLDLLAQFAGESPAVRRVLVIRGEEPTGVTQALESGAIHYVLRSPLHRDVVRRAVALLLDSFHRDRASAALLASLRRLSAGDGDDAETVAELERLGDELAQSTFRDPRTGLYNRRSFADRLRGEIARARRYGQALTVVYLDVDDLDRFNEERGYQAGDRVLATVAELLAGRESDVGARVGGQEFALMLPETDKAGGEVKAERIRQALAALDFDGARVTASFGVATFPDDAQSGRELLEAAITAATEAKGSGKDTVRRAPGDGAPGDGRGREQFTYYHGHLAEITASLEHDLSISCLFVDLCHLRRVEREFGVGVHAEVFARAGELLADTRGSCLRSGDRLFRTEDADGYLCFLSPPRDSGGTPAPLDLDGIARRVQAALVEGLSGDVARLTREPPRIVVGYARVLANPMARSERLILKVIAAARESARLFHQRNSLRDKALLQEIILRDQLIPVYQPIVSLESGEIFGFETLTRGPMGTPLESPTALFGVADEVDLTFELDRACFRGGLRGAAGLSPVHRLFANLLPRSFYDTRFIEGEVERLLHSANLTPANVVFEITERLAIENFTAFRRALATYTAMGFGVAIDDVGTRHSNLETVMALRPHFIKVSDILTRGVSRSTVKREMLRSLQRIAEAIDAVIVAEGIETADDLDVLGELGVRYGQGFYLARPGPAFPELKLERQREILSLATDKTSRSPTLRIQPLVDSFDDEDGPSTGLRTGRGSGEHRVPPDLCEELGLEDLAPRPYEDTRPMVAIEPEPWRPLSAEELGRPEGGSSLLDALRAGDAETSPAKKGSLR